MTQYLIDDEGRECIYCHEYKPWREYNTHMGRPNNKSSACRECRSRETIRERKARGTVDMGAKKRWVCMYDPQNFFAGSFSTMEFELGLESGIWPHDSVWYNRDTRCYYRIAQKTAKFKNKMAMSQFVGWRRNGAEHEKPPVAERQAYAR